MPSWDAEHEVSTDDAKRLIAAQFPELAPVALEPLGVGWDNAAFLVNRCWVFRFPRRQVAVPLLETEARVLPQIAMELPLAVPCPVYRGRPSAAFPWPFTGYALLSGKTLCAAAIDEWDRKDLAVPLGLFLRALHSVPTDSLALPPDAIRRVALDYRLPRAKEHLAQASALGLIDDPIPLTALLDSPPPDWTPNPRCLVHGDLYVRHLLVEGANQLCGVIDWGDLHFGDPTCDLMIAHLVLPPAFHREFLRAYGPVAPADWAVARLRALWHTLIVRLYAHERGDTDLLRESAWTLRALGESLRV